MVGWYDPGQLIRTGVNVVVSMILKSRADYRAIEALARPQSTFDYSSCEGIWLDYVADVGDGWTSTFAIASLLARPSLELGGRDTPRGQVLVMGGDQVYPFASRKAYEERLVAPYAMALPDASDPPDLYSIPGNHDWYDGLASFMRLFCQGRTLGAWRTRQSRSYFALRLPHRWWLVAVDVQLEADIDLPQLEYFETVASEMRPGDRVILCTAEPFWVYGMMYDPALEKNLSFFETEVLRKAGARVVLRLAGDQHHYRHHASSAGSHLITAGGGGAFLHPTHTLSEAPLSLGRVDTETFTLGTEYPTRSESRRLALGNLFFAVRNWRFGLLSATVYVLLASSLKTPTERFNVAVMLDEALRSLLDVPFRLAVCVAVLAGFIVFTDTHVRAYRVGAGLLHGIIQLTAALVVAWGTSLVVGARFASESVLLRQALQLAGNAVGGFVVGSLLLGIYLLISVNVFRRHGNEAFSALRIEDCKNFVRMHINPEGQLTVYPVKLDAVSWWRKVRSRNSPRPELIEAPFRVGETTNRAKTSSGS